MAREINFYLHPGDYYDFDIFLKSFGPVSFIPNVHYKNTITPVTDTIVHGTVGETNRIFLVPQNYYTDFKLRELKEHDLWIIDDFRLPVLYFDRCNFQHDSTRHCIGSGSLYFYSKYEKNGEWISIPEEFKKWAEKIIRTTGRKLFKYEFPIKDKMGYHGDKMVSCYLGKNALAWSIEHKAEFRLGYGALFSVSEVIEM